MDVLANPGPLKDIVLYDQEKHVSSAVWDGQERGALRCHEHTSKLGEWKLKPKQIELVERAGFGFLRRIPAISLDNPLISALVERWRRETNTFHFTIGEMTVTLEDIALLLGLGIDGKPVIGVTYTTCSAICERYLGEAPASNYASGGMVKLSWLKEKFSECEVDASFEKVERCTRAYLLYLVGSTIFSTTTGNKVPVMYLPLFEDFDDAGTFAWGAAALAFLYRALGNASVKSQSTICGCLTLLQCWSYYHLNIGRPKLNREPIHDHFPFVLRWKGKQNGPTANRDVVFYRKALDVLKPCEVEWLPYENMDGRFIPDHIRNSLQLGRSKTMLISFDKAERHLPDRCLKQFGLFQGIPEDVQRWVRKSRGVDGGVDLSVKMESELSEWEMRWENIVPDDVLGVDEADYMRWYLGITRKIVGRPISLSSEFQRTISNVRDILELAENFQIHDLDLERGNMISRIIGLAQDCLRDQVGVTATTESQQQIELGKRMRGKERVRRKGMGKRRKGIDPMEDYGGSEDESQFGPLVEVGQMHLPLSHTNSVYDGTHMYDAVTKVDDMELCDTIPQLPETQDIHKIEGSLLDDTDKSIEHSKLQEEIGTTNVLSGEEPTESYDVKKEDKESKAEDDDATKGFSDVSGEENANREEEDGTEMGESVADSSSLERRGENTVLA
ncbi:Aminotransferase-like plant mobile domain [Arabidopsis thaliana x Arabidopsis arenosa]|uniref:Aminotransferase-like plant mobile domain n=1 Tax=Arabidopsis thaliana x Arabidopsis arenosa TaxID=1240361 RepID=A0A8T2B442_9BRAS|nr:Aminotransferase-like plant mobile domain [Arabidopsis thaliana x Arabidopsis arenosa]KAG7578775.1 Aminotransferase-like plant mobile domain [Arabidopsis thaliana x Arabidopsis arenosa]